MEILVEFCQLDADFYRKMDAVQGTESVFLNVINFKYSQNKGGRRTNSRYSLVTFYENYREEGFDRR